MKRGKWAEWEFCFSQRWKSFMILTVTCWPRKRKCGRKRFLLKLLHALFLFIFGEISILNRIPLRKQTHLSHTQFAHSLSLHQWWNELNYYGGIALPELLAAHLTIICKAKNGFEGMKFPWTNFLGSVLIKQAGMLKTDITEFKTLKGKKWVSKK